MKKTTHARAQILYYLAENLELRRAEIASQLESLMGIEKEKALMEVDLSVRRLFYWAAYSDKYGGVVQVRITGPFPWIHMPHFALCNC